MAFLDNSEDSEDCVVVNLKEVFDVDKTIGNIANLRLGEIAWRTSLNELWHIETHNET